MLLQDFITGHKYLGVLWMAGWLVINRKWGGKLYVPKAKDEQTPEWPDQLDFDYTFNVFVSQAINVSLNMKYLTKTR